ncbi:MAG: alpha/beta fold hydrolase [Thiobacillus sp.]|nr:alpha/beta fold hydrolase [Thiobacillus sp.]
MIATPILLSGLGLALLLLLGFHRVIRHGLAPQRIPERQSPDGLPHREVRFPTVNGRSLYGWFIPATRIGGAPAVALLHGWGGNAETLLPLARPLHQAGFAVLLFDARCHGRSDEDSFASLPRFAEDLEHALGWLHRQPQVDSRRLALVGHSVGAGAALLVASRRDDIAAVASIAAFSHPETMMRRLLASKHIPYVPFGWYVLHYVQHVIGHRFDAIAPLNTIRKVRSPTLLVHGAEDTTVPVAEAYAIYAARPGEHVQLKIIPGRHDDYGDASKEAEALVDFLRTNVDPSCPETADRLPPRQDRS